LVAIPRVSKFVQQILLEEVDETINIFNKKREEFLKMKLQEAINWEKYYLMFISHHSTAIEGSTLTQLESQLLLDEGTTPAGRPLEHSNMEKDHYNALKLVFKEAREKHKVAPGFIRTVSARVMQNTGKKYNVAQGSFDSSKGEYRKVGVFVGETTFPNYQKVEGLVITLCENLEEKINKGKSIQDIYEIAFDFHYDLVSIHPFADGNGRVSRLLMNYILVYHDQVPAIIHKEDRNQYIKSLEESNETKDSAPMRKFMYEQQILEFDRQIEKQRSSDKGRFLTFLS